MGVLPDHQEGQRLAIGPDSLVWRYSSDPRLFFTAGRALLLQVAHPTVSRGVVDHSVFQSDPWGRLLRTADYTNLSVYGGVVAPQVLARTRELHKRVKGGNGESRYHALEPGAWAWVHLSLGESVITAHHHLGHRMSHDQIESFYADWRRIGRLLGLRERDMPVGWDAFQSYFRHTVREELEITETFKTVLDMLQAPPRPPAVPSVLSPVWKASMLMPGQALSLATIGLLPHELRRRAGLHWGISHAVRFHALSRASRAVDPFMVRPIAVTGPWWLRLRQGAITRAPFAPTESRT